MRLSRLVLGCVLLAGGTLTLAGGCQDPTQVTLDISLDRRARCDEIPSGAAITVGVEPASTESQVGQGFVQARTTSCDPGTGHIGTLVVTPSDEGKGAVIVVVGYKDNDPTSCKPPDYAGCIVARRRFTFAEHTRLRMPIVIDPDCANVPCDAFSTCSKGLCVDSQTECANGECETPGLLPDGGVDEASIVTPDGGATRDGDTGPIVEAGRDAPEDAPPGTFCNGDVLVCGGAACGAGAGICCGGACQASCAGDPLCCGPSDCAPDQSCERTNADAGAPGRCKPKVVTGPSCDPVLTCGGLPCNGKACCADDPAQCFDGTECAMPENQYCCTNGSSSECPDGYVCSRPGSAAGQCTPQVVAPHCDGSNNLVCNDSPCTQGTFCCTTDPSDKSCSPDACVQPDEQYCCVDGAPGDCPLDHTCHRPAPAVIGTCKPTGTPPPPPPSCTGNQVVCDGEPCLLGDTCCTTNPVCHAGSCVTPDDQYCCTHGSRDECPTSYACDRPEGSATGTCTYSPLPPTCNMANEVTCGGESCAGQHCCDTNTDTCSFMCGMPEQQLCCKNADCPDGYQCGVAGTPGTPGRCQPAPPPPPPSCDGLDRLTCGGVPCVTQAQICCASSSEQCSDSCMTGEQLCCQDVECQADHHCNNGGMIGQLGTCVADEPLEYPHCSPDDLLHCTPTQACGGSQNACCSDGGGTTCNPGAQTCGAATRRCCSDSECGAGGHCLRVVEAIGPGGVNPAGTCQVMP